MVTSCVPMAKAKSLRTRPMAMSVLTNMHLAMDPGILRTKTGPILIGLLREI